MGNAGKRKEMVKDWRVQQGTRVWASRVWVSCVWTSCVCEEVVCVCEQVMCGQGVCVCGEVVTGKEGKTKEVVKDREVKTVVWGKWYVCMYVWMNVCMYVCMHACMHGPQARYFFSHERRRRRVRDDDGKVYPATWKIEGNKQKRKDDFCKNTKHRSRSDRWGAQFTVDRLWPLLPNMMFSNGSICAMKWVPGRTKQNNGLSLLSRNGDIIMKTVSFGITDW